MSVNARRGADLLVEVLAREALAHDTPIVYALSGNHIMSIFDASLGSGIALVHTRHEAAAVHMADAQARLTGRPAIALVTGGPGHANAVGALYSALMAESPVVLISGQSPVSQAGKGAFQEIDQAAMAAPVCKAAWSLRDAAHLQADLRFALRLAKAGRPGPVSLSIPSDLLELAAPEQVESLSTAAAVYADLAVAALPSDQQHNSVVAIVQPALDWLMQADCPMILLGPMMMRADLRARLTEAQARWQLPMLTLDSPRGVDDPRLGALAGVLQQCDRVLLLGKKVDFTLRFGGAVAFSDRCRFYQLDPDLAELERAKKNLAGRLRQQTRADPLAVLAAIRSLGPQAIGTNDNRSSWLSKVNDAIAQRVALEGLDPADPANEPEILHPAQIGRVLAAKLASHPDAVVISDGGEFGQWVQANIDVPRRIINGPAGAIGLALPMALAARAVERRAPVVALMGDGAFGFHPLEFDTAVRARLPFVIIIGNDHKWNAEYQLQRKLYGEDRLIGCELGDPAYQQIAVALGGVGLRIESQRALAAALDEALHSDRPYCLNVMTRAEPAPVVPASSQ